MSRAARESKPPPPPLRLAAGQVYLRTGIASPGRLPLYRLVDVTATAVRLERNGEAVDIPIRQFELAVRAGIWQRQEWAERKERH